MTRIHAQIHAHRRGVGLGTARSRLQAALFLVVISLIVGCTPRSSLIEDVPVRELVRHDNPRLVTVAVLPESVVQVRADGSVQSGPLVKRETLHLSNACSIERSGSPIFSAAVSGDGRLVAVSMRGMVRVVALHDCTAVAQTQSIDSRIGSMMFSPDSRSLILGAFDGKVYRWRFSDAVAFQKSTTLLFERYVGHAGVVSSVAFHPFGRVFFSADWTGTMRAWLRYDRDDYEGKWDAVIDPGRFYTDVSVSVAAARLSEAIESIAASGDGEYILSATRDGSIQIWSVRGFLMRGQVLGHQGEVRSIAIDRTGRVALTSGRDGFVRQWRISFEDEERKQAKFEKSSELYVPDARFVGFAPDGGTLIFTDTEVKRTPMVSGSGRRIPIED